jgi:cytochrome c-type biogenesis protein CcmH
VRRLVALALIAVSLGAAAPAIACPETTVADLEDEIMCPVCGTSLATAGDAPLAVQQRRLIDRLVKQCRTKDEIKDALVAQYGESVLADPKKDGFGLATYLVPAAALAAGLAAVIVAALRWRRRRPPSTPALAAAGPPRDPAEDDRLDADMRSYDL